MIDPEIIIYRGALAVIAAAIIIGVSLIGAAFMERSRDGAFNDREFVCTRSHTESVIMMLPLGDKGALMPMPQLSEVCDQYTRR